MLNFINCIYVYIRSYVSVIVITLGIVSGLAGLSCPCDEFTTFKSAAFGMEDFALDFSYLINLLFARSRSQYFPDILTPFGGVFAANGDKQQNGLVPQ